MIMYNMVKGVKMNIEFIDNNLNKKISENAELIIYKYYELRVKNNFTKDEMNYFLELVSIRLQNLGYQVYKNGEHYFYNNVEKVVKDNEVLVAVKYT